MIFYDEYSYAKKLIDSGTFINKQFGYELSILAKYYKDIFLHSDIQNTSMYDFIKSSLKDFCKKSDEISGLFHIDVNYYGYINEAIKKCTVAKLFKLSEIYISQKELDAIESADNLTDSRILFTLLVFSKMARLKTLEYKECEKKYYEILSLTSKKKSKKIPTPAHNCFFAKIDKKKPFDLCGIYFNRKKQDDVFVRLLNSGLVEKLRKQGYKILFAHDCKKEDAIITISNFKNFTLYYDKYIGDNIIECEKCQCLIRPKSNKSKYCKECAKEVLKEQWKAASNKYYHKIETTFNA